MLREREKTKRERGGETDIERDKVRGRERMEIERWRERKRVIESREKK